jgi:hypothetical protein
MGLILRKRIKVGPFTLNLTRRGVSTSVRVGPVTYGGRHRRTTVSLPGPFSWWFKRK